MPPSAVAARPAPLRSPPFRLPPTAPAVVPRVAPTRVDIQFSNWADIVSTAETVTLTWLAGDWIVITGCTESNTVTLALPTATGLTFTQIAAFTGTNKASVYLWAAKAASDGTAVTVSSTTTGGSAMRGISGSVWRNSEGLGAVVSGNPGATWTQMMHRWKGHSAVLQVAADWNAVNDITVDPTPTVPSNDPDKIERTTQATFYVNCWLDEGDEGADVNYGITNYTATSEWSMITLEVLGAPVEVGGGVTDLIVDDLVILTQEDAPALTQDHILVVNDLTIVSQEDAAALTQVHILVADDVTIVTQEDGVTLAVVSVLAPDDLIVATQEDAATLTQVHNLAVSDTTQVTQEDSPALTQLHILVANDSTVVTQEDQPALTQVHNLVVNDLTVATQIDDAVLSGAGVLSVADIIVTTQSDTPVLTQVHNLVVADLTVATQSDVALLTQNHQLAVADLVITTQIDSLTLTQVHNLLASDLTQITQVDAVVLQLVTGVTLVVQDIIVVVASDRVRLVSKDWKDSVNDNITEEFVKDRHIQARDDAITRAFITGKVQ